MPYVIPTLRVRERSTLQHWVEAFGLELQAIYPEQGEQVDHAQLRLGDGWLMGRHGPRRRRRPGSGNRGHLLGARRPRRSRCAPRAGVGAGATSIREPNDPEYGGRECSLQDREGNFWSFGTYDPSVG